MTRLRPRTFWLALALAWPVAAVLCWRTGAVPLGWSDVVAAVRGEAAGEATTILLAVRLPRIAVAACAGAGLSIVGVVFQALLRNPLADPYVLGVSGGAALGATLAVALGLTATSAGSPLLPVFAFAGSLGAVALVHRFATTRGRLAVQTMLLAGVCLQAVCSALVLFLQTLLDPTQLLEVFTWLMGRVPSPSWPAVAGLAAVLAVSLGLLLPAGRALNAVSFGERDARALGVDLEPLKRRLIVVSSVLVGAIVALTGLIGFVGIVVPHAVRLAIGPDHRRLVPASAAAGGFFLMIADTLARSLVPPVEVPVGVLTALVGGPFFLLLLRRRGAEAWPA